MGSLSIWGAFICLTFLCYNIFYISMYEPGSRFKGLFYNGIQVLPDRVCSQIGVCIFNGAQYVRLGVMLFML